MSKPTLKHEWSETIKSNSKHRMSITADIVLSCDQQESVTVRSYRLDGHATFSKCHLTIQPDAITRFVYKRVKTTRQIEKEVDDIFNDIKYHGSQFQSLLVNAYTIVTPLLFDTVSRYSRYLNASKVYVALADMNCAQIRRKATFNTTLSSIISLVFMQNKSVQQINFMMTKRADYIGLPLYNKLVDILQQMKNLLARMLTIEILIFPRGLTYHESFSEDHIKKGDSHPSEPKID